MPYKDPEKGKVQKRAYAIKHREQIKRNHLAFRLRRAQRIHDYLGGKCTVCGSTADLEVHHIDPAEKTFGPIEKLSPWAKIVEELKKCELLCTYCHKDKHAARHGSTRMYFLGCRCILCREARSLAEKRYYKTSEKRRAYLRDWARKRASKRAADVDDSSQLDLSR